MKIQNFHEFNLKLVPENLNGKKFQILLKALFLATLYKNTRKTNFLTNLGSANF